MFLLFRVGVGVALRKESVDRKIFCSMINTNIEVALRKESVDRKMKGVEFRCL